MEIPFAYQDIPTQQMDSLCFGSNLRNLISDDMLNSSSELSWCNSPFTTDFLLAQSIPFGPITSDLTRSFHDLESSYYGEERSSAHDTHELSGKRRRLTNHKNGFPIFRSLSYSLDDKMLKALSLFMESSGSGECLLAQVWIPIKTGDQCVLSTCDQVYLLDQRMSQYREVSKKFMFASEPNQCYFPGLPGRVFMSGVPEWTSNVMYYKNDEYLRMNHAIDNEVRGSIAIPILEESGTSCCAVMEIVTSMEKPNFDLEMDSICRALQAVNLQTSAIPRPQYLSSNHRRALAEIQDVLRAVCDEHKLPLALTWIPCSYSNGGKDQSAGENCVLCIEDTACYVNDMEMEGFVHACMEHCLRENEGIAGKTFVSNQPFFASDVKVYDISEYPLVQHARKHGLNSAVAIKLRSTYTGEDDYILELFLPVSMKGSLEQQLLLGSLSSTMQRICRTLRTVSETEKEVSEAIQSGEMSNVTETTCLGSFQTMDSELNSTRSMFSDMSSEKENTSRGSQGSVEQDTSKATPEKKKKSSTEKNVCLSDLQQHFSGSLKDAAKSLGVCPTTLKRICRQHGIMRWPSRKINKVNRSLKKIQKVLDSVQGVEGRLKFNSATGEFIAIGSFIQESVTQKSQQDVADDTSFELLEAKLADNAVKLEEDIITTQAVPGSFMEVNASDQQWVLMAEQSGFNGSRGIKNNDNLSAQAIADGIEPKRSMSDSSNGSDTVILRRLSTSMEDKNQIRTHNSGKSGSTTLIVKATYREDTIRFKFEPSVGCPQLYKDVGKRFKLQDGMFQLNYLDDEEEWVMMVTDSDLHECLEILDAMGKHTVKFLVRDLPPPAGSSAGSNGYLGRGL